MEKTISDFYKKIARKYEDRTVYRHIRPDGSQEQLTYVSLDQRSDRLSRAFQRLGVRKGSKIAFYCDEPLLTIIAYWACFKIGAICIPLNLEDDRLDRILAICDPDYYFVSESTRANLMKYLQPFRDSLLLTGLEEENFPEDTKQSDDLEESTISPVDPAMIFFTSGSTGAPKGVVLSHRNIIHYSMNGGSPYGFSHHDRFLCQSGFHSDMSLFPLLLPLSRGASCVLITPHRRWNPGYLSKVIREERITSLFLVPTILKMMIMYGISFEASSVRLLFISGEKIPVKELASAQMYFFNAQFINLYGNTECNDIMYFRIPADCSAISDLPLGLPLPYADIAVLNDALQPCAEHEVGELYVQSETLMSGYYETNPAQTFVKLDGRTGHYFPTKDMLKYSEGLYYYVGRKDNMIKINAQRVFPGVVESLLRDHPRVAEAVVFPIDKDGKALLAAVVYCEDITSSELREYCATMLPYYSIPGKFTIMEKPLPRTSNGKYDYSMIKQQL